MSQESKSPLAGISKRESEIMLNLLRMPPERQKDAPKLSSKQAQAQRRRREREREAG
jgi:hypothetical protein